MYVMLINLHTIRILVNKEILLKNRTNQNFLSSEGVDGIKSNRCLEYSSRL